MLNNKNEYDKYEDNLCLTSLFCNVSDRYCIPLTPI
jgi:hypothetical protein